MSFFWLLGIVILLQIWTTLSNHKFLSLQSLTTRLPLPTWRSPSTSRKLSMSYTENANPTSSMNENPYHVVDSLNDLSSNICIKPADFTFFNRTISHESNSTNSNFLDCAAKSGNIHCRSIITNPIYLSNNDKLKFQQESTVSVDIFTVSKILPTVFNVASNLISSGLWWILSITANLLLSFGRYLLFLASKLETYLTSQVIGKYDTLLQHELTSLISKSRWIYGRNSVLAAIEALQNGQFAIVLDNDDREGEGDLVLAAQFSNPFKIAYMVEHTSGVICAPMLGERLDKLSIPDMTFNNEDFRKTPFTLSVDLKNNSTGISAKSRSDTLVALADNDAVADWFVRPGHIFPLRYTYGGVFRRGGHTEAAIDLMRLAGLRPIAVISEIVSIRNPILMASQEEVLEIAVSQKIPVTTIEDLISYRLEEEYNYNFEIKDN